MVIYWLDSNGPGAALLGSRIRALTGLVTAVVTESQLGNPDSYQVPEGLLELLDRETEVAPPFVVLGNNLGAGLIKAQHIAEAARARTIVVYSLSGTFDKESYEALGYRHFVTRRELLFGKYLESHREILFSLQDECR